MRPIRSLVFLLIASLLVVEAIAPLAQARERERGFLLPTRVSEPQGITAGPDGNLWFTEFLGNKIGRITTAGVITEFPIPMPFSGPHDITTGPDGNMWFTESSNKIGTWRLQR